MSSNEVVLKVEEVSNMINEAKLNCAHADSIKNEKQMIVAKDLANMFGAWREVD